MTNRILTALLLLLAAAASPLRAEDHNHDHKHTADGKHDKKQAGPTGGRLITTIDPHLEFLVNPDKKIEIRFVDDSNKVIPPAGQTVTVTMGDRAAPTKLTFTQSGDKLISDQPIPAGDDLPTVLQIKSAPDAKPIIERFNLGLAKCPTCDYPEYACVCDHDEDDHGHDHGDKKKD